MFKCSNIQMFNWAIFRQFKYLNVQLVHLKSSYMFKCSNVHPITVLALTFSSLFARALCIFLFWKGSYFQLTIILFQSNSIQLSHSNPVHFHFLKRFIFSIENYFVSISINSIITFDPCAFFTSFFGMIIFIFTKMFQ